MLKDHETMPFYIATNLSSGVSWQIEQGPILLYNFLFSHLFCVKAPFVCWLPPHNPLRTQNIYFYVL